MLLLNGLNAIKMLGLLYICMVVLFCHEILLCASFFLGQITYVLIIQNNCQRGNFLCGG